MLSTMLEFLKKGDANITSLHYHLLQSQNANTINPDGNWTGQYFALRLMLIYSGIDVVMNEETYFPRLSDFNFDFISENVGLIRGSSSQHICIKRMTPLLPDMSVGYSGLNWGISCFATWLIISKEEKWCQTFQFDHLRTFKWDDFGAHESHE